MNLSQQDRERFWKYVDRSGECWTWRGSVNGKRGGYGKFQAAGKTLAAHRVAFAIFYGDPGELDVLHQCDNPPCCNPSHLFLGTHQDNMADRNTKGRQARGDRSGSRLHPETHRKEHKAPHIGRCTKLTGDQVIEIRALYDAGGITQQQIATRYGVVQQTVGHIIRGRRRG